MFAAYQRPERQARHGGDAEQGRGNILSDKGGRPPHRQRQVNPRPAAAGESDLFREPRTVAIRRRRRAEQWHATLLFAGARQDQSRRGDV